MLERRRFYLALFLPLVASGCGPLFGTPQIWPPAPESVQINRAKKFDPFPDPSIGPPVIGGRPQGFLDPRPDPDPNKTVRADWLNPPVGAGYPPPGYYPAPGTAYPPPGATIYTYPSTIQAAPAASVSATSPRIVYPATVPLSAPPVVTSTAPMAPTAAPIAYGKKIDAP
jgi:hypothetical protein